MAYNPNNRRGVLSRRGGARKKRQVFNGKETSPINHNGLFPYMQAFIEWSGVVGLTAQTLRTREDTLRRWILWCDERGLDHPNQITKPILERYQKYLHYYRKSNGDPLGVSTQQSMLMPLRAFFKWLCQQNHILYNPASELVLPKLPQGLPRAILSVEEVERVMSQPNTSTASGLRDRAILETFYSTGVRKSECAQLQLQDVDYQRGIVMVRQGKGNKDRVLPLGERLRYWLSRYILEVRDQFVVDMHDRSLFLTDYGEPWIKDRLRVMVKRYLYHAEIEKPGACHLFRHAMATHMLENGADIRFIQAMLGHADLSTTEIYTRVSVEKLREIHSATHPAKMEQDSMD